MSKGCIITLIICGCLLSATIMAGAMYFILNNFPWWGFWFTWIGYDIAQFCLSNKIMELLNKPTE